MGRESVTKERVSVVYTEAQVGFLASLLLLERKGHPTSHLCLHISHQDPFLHNGFSQQALGTILTRDLSSENFATFCY